MCSTFRRVGHAIVSAEGSSRWAGDNQTGRSCFRRLLAARPAGSSPVAWVQVDRGGATDEAWVPRSGPEYPGAQRQPKQTDTREIMGHGTQRTLWQREGTGPRRAAAGETLRAAKSLAGAPENAHAQHLNMLSSSVDEALLHLVAILLSATVAGMVSPRHFTAANATTRLRRPVRGWNAASLGRSRLGTAGHAPPRAALSAQAAAAVRGKRWVLFARFPPCPCCSRGAAQRRAGCARVRAARRRILALTAAPRPLAAFSVAALSQPPRRSRLPRPWHQIPRSRL